MPQTQSGTIAAYFNDENSAHQAIEALQQAGFDSNQIGIAAASGGASGATGTEQMGTSHTSTGSTTGRVEHKAAGVWDKVKNFFEGGSGDVEPYADERDRDSVQSHEITGASSYSDYEPGDVHHALSGMSVDDQRSRYFSHRVSNAGGVLVTVTATGRESEAETILTRFGGDLGQNSADYDYSSTAATGRTTGEVTGQQRLQLLGEILRVHKERVNRGEVRVRKEVITEQQTVQVPVTREELVVERVPVEGQRGATGTIGENSEIRIPLTEERASAEKQTVVREEYAVGKRASERVEQVGGEVRHEELDVEDTTRQDPTLDRRSA